MAIIPSTDYSGQIDTSDSTGYPHGKAQNVTVAGDGTGTPLEQDWVNDLWGFLQALLDRAGITPSGNPDKVGTSDYLDSLSQWLGTSEDLVHRGYAITTTELRATKDVSAWSTDQGCLAVTDDGLNLYVGESPAGVGWIIQYKMSTAHDISTATEYDTLNVDTYESSVQGLHIAPDGLNLFMIGASDEVRRISMSSANDLTTATIETDNFDVTTQTSAASGLAFDPDGNTFIVFTAVGTAQILEYSTASPWIVAGATYQGAFDVSTEATTTSGRVRFDGAGRRVFILESHSGNTSNILQYNLEVAYEVAGSAGQYANVNVDLGGYSDEPRVRGIGFSASGRHMYAATDSTIMQFYTGITQIG